MRRTWLRLSGLLVALGLAGFVSRADAAGPRDTPASPAPVLLKAGETIPPFEATGINGEIREVKYKTPTVLLFFLSSCPVCHKMIPEWNQAFERKPDGLEVVGVLMDREPPGFFAVTPVSVPGRALALPRVRPHLQGGAGAHHPAGRRGRQGGGRRGGRPGSDPPGRALPAIARGTSRQPRTRSQTRSARMPVQRERLRSAASSRSTEPAPPRGSNEPRRKPSVSR